MSEPLVSISCITYNHAPFIHECLDGFLMQKTNFSFEILIHDDASTDGTKEIIEQYVSKYPDFIFPIYQSENQYSKGVRGMMPRFNFSRAKGKFIALCEGDDCWTDAFKLQKQVDFLEENREFIATCHKSKLVDSSNVFIGYQPRLDQNESFNFNTLIKGWFIPTSSILFRNNINFNEILKYKDVISGDRLLTILLAEKANFYYSQECMSIYRKHSGGISSFGDRLEIFKSNVNLFKQLYSNLSRERRTEIRNQIFYWKVKVIEEYKSRSKTAIVLIQSIKLLVFVRSYNDLKTVVKMFFT